MAKNYEDQLDEIGKGIKDMAKYIAKQSAIQASNDLYDAKDQIVSSFYGDYKRKSHTTRKKLLEKSIIIDNVVGRDKSYVASMHLDGSKMDENVNPGDNITGEGILDLIWNQGVRGLPEYGDNPISKSYDFFGNHFDAGERWHNPYWDPNVYGNIFRVKIKIGNFTSHLTTPNNAILQLIHHWGNKRSKDVFDYVFNKAIKKYNIEYKD